MKGKVFDLLIDKSNNNNFDVICKQLDLEPVFDRQVSELSGGELQRFAIAMLCLQDIDIYLFDEPSSYLDIKQRLKAANVIRSMVGNVAIDKQKYVVVIVELLKKLQPGT